MSLRTALNKSVLRSGFYPKQLTCYRSLASIPARSDRHLQNLQARLLIKRVNFIMNCENCGQMLSGGTIICRECKHNNALRRVGEKRARRVTTESSETPGRRLASFAAPTRAESRTPPAKVQLLRPLTPAAPALVAQDELELRQYPPWRAQLKEKVRQARERRQLDEPERAPAAGQPHRETNPLVKSALKRLQRSDQSTAVPARPRIVRRGTPVAALAHKDEREAAPAPKPAPKPELKPVARDSAPINSLLPPRADHFSHQQPAPPAAEPAPVKRAESNDTKILPLRPATPPDRPIPAPAESELELPPASPVETKAAPRLEPPQAEQTVAAPDPLPSADKEPSDAPPWLSAPSVPADKPDPETALATPLRQFIPARIIGPAPSAQAAPEAKLPTFILAPARDVQTATLWARTLAGVCDFEVVCASFLPLFASYATFDNSLGSESLVIIVGLLAIITFCYQMLMLTLAGRTFGMAMLKLQLFNRDAETRPPTRRQHFNRALGATVAFLCPPLNLLVMHLNYERRSLPDLCSQTTIIES